MSGLCLSLSDYVLGWMSAIPWDKTEQPQISSVSWSPYFTLGCKPLQTWDCCLLLCWFPISSSSLCLKILRFPSFLWTQQFKTWEFSLVQSRSDGVALLENISSSQLACRRGVQKLFKTLGFLGCTMYFILVPLNGHDMGIKDHGKH